MNMKVLSLFDGMACGLQSLKDAGASVTEYHAFEVDKHAINVAKANHPEIIHHGEVTFMTDFSQFKGFDLLIAGSPCQGFSFAGKQLNFNDPRSQLFFEFVRAKNEIRPRFFMLENVAMQNKFRDVITEYVGLGPVKINSALVSAQNRVRYYWCNWKVEQPDDHGIMFADVEEQDYLAYNSEAWHEWFDAKGEYRQQKGFMKVVGSDSKAAAMTARQVSSWGGNVVDVTTAIGDIRGRRIDPTTGRRADYNKDIPIQQYVECNMSGKSNCLTTVLKDNVVLPHFIEDRLLLKKAVYRFISPIEAERLQTLPDNYTAAAPKTHRYKMLGNGWTRKVITHLFSKMLGA